MIKTIDDLIRAGEALFGPRWQTPLARSLGMRDAASIRSYLSGRRRIPAGTATRVTTLLAHDEWIVGFGAAHNARYIVHARWPRFYARIDQSILTDIIWSDAVPPKAELLALLQRAAIVAKSNQAPVTGR